MQIDSEDLASHAPPVEGREKFHNEFHRNLRYRPDMLDISTGDFAVIGLLIFMEGILSIDNALAIAVIAGRLPEHQRKKALTYGLVGAFVFRAGAIGIAAWLIHWTWVKYVGGAYLLWMAIHHFLAHKKADQAAEQAKPNYGSRAQFWKTIVVIELTDIAFAVDSILAAVALSPKLWVVITGGICGMLMMRFAATLFLKLLQRFPAFEDIAFVLVGIIGIKITLEAMRLPALDFHSPRNPGFWVFWVLILVTIAAGFLLKKKSALPAELPKH